MKVFACCCKRKEVPVSNAVPIRSKSNQTVVVPMVSQSGDAHIYAAVKLQQNMRNAIQKKLSDKKAASDKTATAL